MNRQLVVLAIDPGTEKCGVAVLDGEGRVLLQAPAQRSAVAALAGEFAGEFRVTQIVVGDGVGGRGVAAELAALGLPLQLFPETDTTLRARELYFRENRPRGWRRLIPRGLLAPPRPVDDYAAVIIGREFIESLRQAQ